MNTCRGRRTRWASSPNSVAVSSTSAPSTSTRRRAWSTDHRADGVRALLALGPSGPAHAGLDPGHELAGAERLGDVVVGSQLEAEHAVDLVVASGAEEDRRPVAVGPQPAADLDPVQAGQPDVEHHGDRVGGCARRRARPARRSRRGPRSPHGRGRGGAGRRSVARPRRRGPDPCAGGGAAPVTSATVARATRGERSPSCSRKVRPRGAASLGAGASRRARRCASPRIICMTLPTMQPRTTIPTPTQNQVSDANDHGDRPDEEAEHHQDDEGPGRRRVPVVVVRVGAHRVSSVGGAGAGGRSGTTPSILSGIEGRVDALVEGAPGVRRASRPPGRRSGSRAAASPGRRPRRAPRTRRRGRPRARRSTPRRGWTSTATPAGSPTAPGSDGRCAAVSSVRSTPARTATTATPTPRTDEQRHRPTRRPPLPTRSRTPTPGEGGERQREGGRRRFSAGEHHGRRRTAVDAVDAAPGQGHREQGQPGADDAERQGGAPGAQTAHPAAQAGSTLRSVPATATARRTAAALLRDSVSSASGSESATIPPPAWT